MYVYAFHGLALDLHHMLLILFILSLAFRHVEKIHPQFIDSEYQKRRKIQSKQQSYVR